MAGNDDPPGIVDQNGARKLLAAEADDVVAGAVEGRVEYAIAVEAGDREVGVAAVGVRVAGDDDAAGRVDRNVAHGAHAGDVRHDPAEIPKREIEAGAIGVIAREQEVVTVVTSSGDDNSPEMI